MSNSRKNNLTARQGRFVQEYLIDLNATQAAIRAGYSEKTAGQVGFENLKKPEIVKAIQKGVQKREDRIEIRQDYVLKGIVSVIERCMQAEPVKSRNGRPVLTENVDGEMVPAYTFNSAGALRGCELLGKHLGMFVQKHEVTGKDGGPIRTVSSVMERIWAANEAKKCEDV
jgi:phage terminase small subunit